MNPPGVFIEGKRQREYSTTRDLLPMSGKLIPEFAGRRNIRDMFSRKSSLTPSSSFVMQEELPTVIATPSAGDAANQDSQANATLASPISSKSPIIPTKKRSAQDASVNTKRAKSLNGAGPPAQNVKSQQTLKGFFSSKSRETLDHVDFRTTNATPNAQKGKDDKVDNGYEVPISSTWSPEQATLQQGSSASQGAATGSQLASTQTTDQAPPSATSTATPDGPEKLHDPIESKESWSKLFAKPIAPRCEGHNEPCITLLTKKPGMNLGRSFWMCPRPLGPSGAKEKNTQWRCQTFIWCSDWNPHAGMGM